MTPAALQTAATASIATLADWCRNRVAAEPIPTGVRLRGEFKTIEAVAVDLLQAGATVEWTDVPEDPDTAAGTVATGGSHTSRPRRGHRAQARLARAALPGSTLARSPTRPPSPAAPPETHPLAAHRALLGTVADEVIAARAGVSRSVVGAYRRKLGIPAYDGYKFVPGQPGVQASGRKATSGGRKRATVATSAPAPGSSQRPPSSPQRRPSAPRRR